MVCRLQLLKEHETVVGHELILLTTVDNHMFRIDRAAITSSPLQVFSGTKPHDEIKYVDRSSLIVLQSTTQCLVDCTGFSVPQSLIQHILCVIQADDQGESYTIERFNCYFFARCFVIMVARYAVLMQTIVATKINKEELQAISVSPTHASDGNRWQTWETNMLQGWNPKRPLRQPELERLRQELQERIFKEIVARPGKEGISIDLHDALYHTLWRDDAERAVDRAVNVAMSKVKDSFDLIEWRRNWVLQTGRDWHLGVSKLASVWEASWKDVWVRVRRQALRDLGPQLHASDNTWRRTWDYVCGEQMDGPSPTFEVYNLKKRVWTGFVTEPQYVYISSVAGKDQSHRK
jgi:hypothetical protein